LLAIEEIVPEILLQGFELGGGAEFRRNCAEQGLGLRFTLQVPGVQFNRRVTISTGMPIWTSSGSMSAGLRPLPVVCSAERSCSGGRLQ